MNRYIKVLASVCLCLAALLSYSGPSNAQQTPAITGPYLVTPEGTGTTSAWTGYQGSAQTFTNGPFQLLYDSTNGLMYSANWNAGLWVLKVIP